MTDPGNSGDSNSGDSGPVEKPDGGDGGRNNDSVAGLMTKERFNSAGMTIRSLPIRSLLGESGPRTFSTGPLSL
jgi:hypothetical protein